LISLVAGNRSARKSEGRTRLRLVARLCGFLPFLTRNAPALELTAAGRRCGRGRGWWSRLGTLGCARRPPPLNLTSAAGLARSRRFRTRRRLLTRRRWRRGPWFGTWGGRRSRGRCSLTAGTLPTRIAARWTVGPPLPPLARWCQRRWKR